MVTNTHTHIHTLCCTKDNIFVCICVCVLITSCVTTVAGRNPMMFNRYYFTDLFKERPFRCLEEGCGQTFITANWLNRHREKKHGGIVFIHL